MALLQYLLLSACVFAGDIKAHKSEIREYNGSVARYEHRMIELKEQKKQVKGGDQLEEILGEIADIHRELLSIRKKRQDLKRHLQSDHPESDLFYDVSLHKKYQKKKKGKQDPVDKDLDVLLLLVQSQYAKYITVGGTNKAKETLLQKEVQKSKKRAKEKTRKEYLRKRIKTELEI